MRLQSWYRSWASPYYNESHRVFRAKVRQFTEEHIMPFCHEVRRAARATPAADGSAAAGAPCPSTRHLSPPLPSRRAVGRGQVAAQEPVREGGRRRLAARLRGRVADGAQAPPRGAAPRPLSPPHPRPLKAYVGPPPPELANLDYFHELVLIDELSRCGSGGVLWGMFGGLSIGLPPIMNFGSKYLQDKVVRDCLAGRKFICLGITEPYAGSDVANIRTSAKLSACGKFYVVNGEKKWITNGVFCDYFTVAVRTGGEGAGGISLLLLERGMAGLETKQMKCMGVWPSGTTYITMDEVKVPVENLIGTENQGFKYIM